MKIADRQAHNAIVSLSIDYFQQYSCSDSCTVSVFATGYTIREKKKNRMTPTVKNNRLTGLILFIHLYSALFFLYGFLALGVMAFWAL